MNTRPATVTHTEANRAYRARMIARGLTSKGKPRQRENRGFRAWMATTHIAPTDLRSEGVVDFGHLGGTSILFVQTEARIVLLHVDSLPARKVVTS